MKKEVCLMCIVCFFLGYFVCDVIGKCGFKKPPPPPHEHYRETEDFEAPKLSAQQLRSDSQNLTAVGGDSRREFNNKNNNKDCYISPGGYKVCNR